MHFRLGRDSSEWVNLTVLYLLKVDRTLVKHVQHKFEA